MNNFIDKTKLNSDYECQLPYTKTYIGKTGTQYGIDKEKVKYCCKKFEDEIGLSLYFRLEYDCKKSESFPVIAYDRVDGHDFEHSTVDCIEDVPISFCPFCGGEIRLYLSKEMEQYVKECKEEIVRKPVYGVKEIETKAKTIF